MSDFDFINKIMFAIIIFCVLLVTSFVILHQHNLFARNDACESIGMTFKESNQNTYCIAIDNTAYQVIFECQGIFYCTCEPIFVRQIT